MPDTERLEQLAQQIENADHWITTLDEPYTPEGHSLIRPNPETMAFRLDRWAMECRQPGGTCRTAGCIAGFTLALFGDKKDVENFNHHHLNIQGIARRLLDLDMATSDILFAPRLTDEAERGYLEVRPMEAAEAVRRVADGKTETHDIWGHVWGKREMQGYHYDVEAEDL